MCNCLPKFEVFYTLNRDSRMARSIIVRAADKRAAIKAANKKLYKETFRIVRIEEVK